MRRGVRIAFDGGLGKQVLTQGVDAIDEMLAQTIPAMKQSGGGWIVALDHRVVKDTSVSDFQYYVTRVHDMI